MKQHLSYQNEVAETAANRLTGWLSIYEESDISRKSGCEVVWKLKSVTFCPKSKRLFISPLPGDNEQEISLDSPSKSPGTDLSGSSPKSNNGDIFFSSYRSNSIAITNNNNNNINNNRGRLETQSSNSSFKQFISKKLAISRTRSTGKIGTQAASPKSPNALMGSWRSADSDHSLDDEASDGISISLNDPELSIIRPIHSSLLSRSYCFQILTPGDMKYFSCCTEEEYNTWFTKLNNSIHCDRNFKVRLNTSLSIWIIEAKGIPIRKRYYCEALLDKVCFARTSVKYKNDMLFWGEQFNFDDLPPTESVTISLFRESDTKKKRKPDRNIFVGSSVIDLLSFETNTEIEKWVSVYIPGISPKMQQKTTVAKTEQAFIRTKLKYDTTVVLPLDCYTKLHEYIMKNYLTLTCCLEVSVNLKTKDLLAQTLLRILHSSDSAEQFLVDVIMNEVNKTTNDNLTFRGNSLATKSIDTYMKMIGRSYLQETLGRFITTVYESEEDAEVDPQKLTSSTASLLENQKYLKQLVEEAWKSIFLSLRNFPRKLQNIFSMIRKKCEAIGREEIVNKVVSASLFLRLLCPAILSPSLFQLTQEYPGEKVARALTLVAKTIQNLANFTHFGSKESYMEILNEFVEREIPNMTNFLQTISYDRPGKETKNDSCVSCGNIDLGRELSVLYHLLLNELSKLSTESFEKIKELKPLIDEITVKYQSSPKAEELRLSKPFATVASVCRKPLSHPVSRDDASLTLSETATPTSINVENFEMDFDVRKCYHDSSLSFSEDYVSGCSLLHHRSGSTRTRSNCGLPRTEGRAEQAKKSRFTPDAVIHKREFCNRSHSVGDAMSPSNGTKVFETRGKFDKLLVVSAQAANNSRTTHMKHNKSEEPTLTGFKKRMSINSESTSPSRRGSKENGSVKDRISMFSQRSPSSPAPTRATFSLKSPSTPNKRVDGQIPVLRKHLEGESKSTVSRKPPPLVKTKPATSQKPVEYRRNTKRQSESSSEQSITELDHFIPDTYSTAAEHQLQFNSYNRNQLQLENLNKDHKFVDDKSLNNLRSPKHDFSSSDLNGKTSHAEKNMRSLSFSSPKNTNKPLILAKPQNAVCIERKEQAHSRPLINADTQNEVNKPMPLPRSFSCGTVENSSPKKLHTKSEAALDTFILESSLDANVDKTVQHHQSGTNVLIRPDNFHKATNNNYKNCKNENLYQLDKTKHKEVHTISSLMESEDDVFYHKIKQPSTENPNQSLSSEVFEHRRHSEMSTRDLEKCDFRRETEIVEKSTQASQIHSNGFREVLHEGIIERSNSYMSSSDEYMTDSYYSEDEEIISNGVYIQGDNLSDILMHSTNDTPSRNGTLGSNSSSLAHRSSMYSRKGSTQSTLEKKNKFNNMDEVNMLRQKLKNTEAILHKTRHELKSRTSNFEQTVIHLKDKLTEADKKMKIQRSETDSQMKSVIARLLNVENELRNEHTEMEAIIKGKEKIIDIQERRINSLEATNTKLVDALTRIKNKYAPELEDILNDEHGNTSLDNQERVSEVMQSGDDKRRARHV